MQPILMPAFTTSRRLRRAAVLAVLLLATGWMAWHLANGRWHSSPTRSRAHLHTCRVYPVNFVDGYFPENLPVPIFMSPFGNTMDSFGVLPRSWNGVRENSMRTPLLQRAWSGFRVTEPPGAPILIEGVPADPRENRNKLVSIPVAFHFAGEGDLTWHGIGTELRLEAFAVTASGPAFSTNRGVVTPVAPVTSFHHARQPEAAASESVFPAGIFLPGQQELALNRLTLLFRILGNPDIFRARGIAATVYDARTHAVLGAGLWPRFCATDQGNFLMIDAYISLWHDTPLHIVLDLPEGPVQRQNVDLAQKGAVYEFAGERAPRVTMLMALDGYQAARADPGMPVQLYRVSWTREPCVSVFWDLGELKNADFLDLEFPRADGGWGGQRLRNDFKGWNPAPEGKWRLTYYPGYQRVCFRIPGMPMMPNGREIRDLLDVKIPWTADDQVSYESLAAMLQLTLVPERRGGTSSPSSAMMSIREKLKQDQESGLPSFRITIDSRKMQMRVSERKPSWTDHVQEWWKKHVKAP